MAIELPGDARAEVARATAPFRGADDALRWTRTENLHLTLAFLGEMPEERVPALTEALAGAAAQVAPFALTLSGVGGFPGLRRPRVVWAGVAAPDALGRLHAAVEAALVPHGYLAERRPYTPHLTLARAQGGRAQPMPELAERAAEVELGTSLEVKEIVLMRSRTEAGGARYERLAALALTGAD